ncbi:MAG TPA: hypothetical protein VFI85_04015 [Methyloceanibacter sp.]|nr:hypothetical protein [Methyloceanibacter sp.]
MRQILLVLGAAGLASAMAMTPANALVGSASSGLRTAQSVGSDVTPVHCKRHWHCHKRGCHRCGGYYHRRGHYWRWWW